METTASARTQLGQLRGVFLVWFVAQCVLGNWSAVRAIQQLRGSARFAGELESVTPAYILGVSLVSEALVLALALLVFWRLLRLADWARILLLVFGWLGALGAAISLLTSPSPALLESWLDGFLPGVDWRGLGRLGLLSDALSLAFWSYLVFTLQFQPAVRAAFGADEPPR
jgi:hypothetical protein